MERYAGIEGGGTKFVVACGSGPDDLGTPVVYPTTTPDATLSRAIDEVRRCGPVAAVGVASFGPVDLRPGSDTYGHIMETPKSGWSGTDVAGRLREGLGIPVGFDTDVNGAALAEHRWGAARDVDSFIYVTVGTGIGGGGLVRGEPMHGLSHPEMGHMRIPRHPDDEFGGGCPFHGDCLEGMAAGPALEERWGRRAENLGPDTAAAVALEGWYLGTAFANLALALSPERIVAGGGVMKLPGLFDRVRDRFLESLNGYLKPAPVLDPASFIVAPGLGDRAGVLGAIALASDATRWKGSDRP